jgi:hypothetical protein
VALVAVSGFEQRLRYERLKQEDRQRIEAELKAFRAQVYNGVTIKPVTYRNPRSCEDEPGAEVFLAGTSEPIGWIPGEHLPLVKSELTGVLISGGPYTLKVLCPLVRRNQPVAPAQPTVVNGAPLDPVHHPVSQGRPVMYLGVVNGWQSKIKCGSATMKELFKWTATAGRAATVRPTTFERRGAREPAVAVYLEGQEEQFGWLAREYIRFVDQELHGHLASGSLDTLTFISEA